MVRLFSFLLLEDSLFRDCCKVDGGTGSHSFARQANFQAALGAVPCARAPPACTAQGRSRALWLHCPSPAAPLLSSPTLGGFAVCQPPGLPYQNLGGKWDGTQTTLLAPRRALLHFTPFSAQQRRKVLEEQDLSSCEISKSNDKHMEVCPARAHPPVQILGQVTWCLASSFKRALFIYSSQEFGTLFFNLPTSFTSSCSACSPRAFFFLPLTLPVLDDYYINRDSSWGWGSLPAN